ncbi:formate dehydrogenase accessory sulfurtransferase FdhD [Candidatus Sumerlaeota bacterium]|nr:formate dehydrogenase accessory sulfurtransferase FdhD [Candidatus Sumerlaeota bacterium]
MNSGHKPHLIVRYAEDGRRAREEDTLTVEEPLEIRVGGKPLAVLMRTPGEDIALAAGFLLTEGIVRGAEQIGSIAHCDDSEDQERRNVVDVVLAAGTAFDLDRFGRNFYASSSCGICGKASIEAIKTIAPPLRGDWRAAAEMVAGMAPKLGSAQKIFARTGSLHAAGLFTREGELKTIAEDVGRHNAVDKVIGSEALEGRLPLDALMLMVSGRISFEITQKALMAGIPLIGAVSGASSLAVELAMENGMTLAGFIRGGGMTVYCGEERIEG